MQKLISVVLFTLLLVPAFAEAKKAGPNDREIHALISKIQHRSDAAHKKIRKLSDPLIRFSITPGSNVEQGDNVAIYATLNSGFTDSETFLSNVKFDGADITVEHPSDGLWLYNAGAFTEMNKQHTLSATLFLQDKAQAQQIRDAVATLEAQIQDLNDRIANSTDQDLIAQLTAQRDQKTALKDQLVAQLANLKSPVTTESVSFSIVAKETGTDFPRISNVSPNLVKASGGSTITISGANFGSDPQVSIGGVSTPVSTWDASSIVMDTPSLPTGQTHDIEIRFDNNGVIKNAIRKNAVYATDDVVAVPVPSAPVAIAEAVNSPMVIGNTAQVTAVHSFSATNQPLSYDWRLISKPNGSALPLSPDFAVSLDRDYSFSPDIPGNYVMALRVRTTSAPFWPESVSLVVVEADAPSNRAPTGSAPSILVSKNFSKTSQITASDADFWQARSFFVTKQSAYGNATVSSSGLVSFQAGANPGADTLEVSIVDNGTPPLATVVSIPVSVVENQPPVIQSTPAAFQRTQGSPFQVRFGLFGIGSGAVTDPDGTIQSLVWDFGDGTHERITDYAAASVVHNYLAPSTYQVSLTATDNLGATTTVTGTAVVTDEDIPTAKVKVSQVSGAVPMTVTFDASESSVQSGSIQQYRWIATGQSTETVTTTPYFTFTFTNPYVSGATPGIRLRTRTGTGATAREGEMNVGVYPGNGGQTNASYQPQQLIGPPREVLVNQPVSFDGSRSTTPNPGQTISSYIWNYGDIFNCPSCGGSGLTTSYSFARAWNFSSTLQVQTNTGAFSGVNRQEFFVVNAGHAPHTVPIFDRVSGPAPLTVHGDCSGSYDYDGTINGGGWNFGDSTPSDTNLVTTHTYTMPNTYFMQCFVYDNDNNGVISTQVITVTPSAKELTKRKADAPPSDATREYERQVLAGSCANGDGEACYQLGQMYQEDGDEYTKTKLWEKACGMGYQAACSR